MFVYLCLDASSRVSCTQMPSDAAVGAPDAMAATVYRSAKQALEVVSQSAAVGTRPVAALSDDDNDDDESDSGKMVICEDISNGMFGNAVSLCYQIIPYDVGTFVMGRVPSMHISAGRIS